MSEQTDKKIDATDAKDDAQKANKLEGEAKKDKDKENGDTINKENEKPSLEDEVSQVRDNQFLAKQILDTRNQLEEIKTMLRDLAGLDKSITNSSIKNKNGDDSKDDDQSNMIWVGN